MDTKQNSNGIFAADNQNRVRSPEELDNYIRVQKPGTLILVLALALVVVALIVWGFIGTLPVTKNVTGVLDYTQNRLISGMNYYKEVYNADIIEIPDLPEEELYRLDAYFFVNTYEFSRDDLLGKEVIISRPGKSAIHTVVADVIQMPYDRKEVLAEFGEWIANTCPESDYSWVGICRIDSADYAEVFTLVDVTIVTDNIHPISFLFR